MKDKQILDLMIERSVIPNTGTFEVKEPMLISFVEIYGSLHSNKNGLKPKEVKYAKKLAGLSLMKLNLNRSSLEETDIQVAKARLNKPKCGLVYLITNPAWPNLAKIGITQNISYRLAQYQTGDPYRKYKVEHYKFVEDMRSVEEQFLKIAKTDLAKGEWVPLEIGKKLILGHEYENRSRT